MRLESWQAKMLRRGAVGVVAVSIPCSPRISSLSTQVASGNWKETRRFNEAAPMERVWAKTNSQASHSLLGCDM